MRFIDAKLHAEDDYIGMTFVSAQIRIHFDYHPATRDFHDEPGSGAYVEFSHAERIDCVPYAPVSGKELEWAKRVLDLEEDSAIEAAEVELQGDPDARRDARMDAVWERAA